MSGVAVAAILASTPATAQDGGREVHSEAPGAGASDAAAAPAPTMMVLEASVNGRPTRQLVAVTRSASGAFTARVEDLRRLRIHIDPQEAPSEEVSLAALGVMATYDEAKQAFDLTVPVERLETTVIGLGGDRKPTDLDRLKPLPGMILNYGLYATQTSGDTTVSGNLEALAMTPAGVFSSTGLFNSRARFGGADAVRLDTNWRLIDPRAIRSYTLGDFTSNALSWTGSVRLAGFQIASAFDQRPDLVTTALPQFSGSAALPSTLDLYVNQQRIFSGDIPAGPFDLRALPFVSGGDVRLVTTDATGRQVEINKSYYYVARQLRAGVFQYSLDVGAPRLGYGLRSFDYDDTVFASGTVRYGVNGALTLEGHAEGSADGLVNGGFGVVQTVGGVGAVSGSFAASNYDGRAGGKYAIEVEGQLGGMRVFAATERTIDDYFDLSRVSILRDSERYARRDDDIGRWLAASARASRLDRAGVSFTPSFDPTSVSLTYNRIDTPLRRQRTANLSLTRRLSDQVSLYANGFLDLDEDDRYGVFATLSFRFGQSVNASAGVQHNASGVAYLTQAAGVAGQRQGDVGWGIANREYDNGDAQRSAYVSYRASEALVRAQIDQSGGAWRGSLQAEGSIVAAGGGVFLANRIGDAFAIVRNAGPDVEVLQGGVRMGRTNGDGRALLPDLIPYYEQRIMIDPTGLPDGWEAQETEQIAAAGYRQGTIVDFGARPAHAAIIILHRPDGAPIAPGALVRLGDEEPAIVGYDGQVYLRGLGASNRITVDLGADGRCDAVFDYPQDGPAQPQIGPLTCR